MSKYSIEYLKHKLYVCCDSLCCYINLVLSEHDNNFILFSLLIQKMKCIMVLNK